jgi:hypothetical protein
MQIFCFVPNDGRKRVTIFWRLTLCAKWGLSTYRQQVEAELRVGSPGVGGDYGRRAPTPPFSFQVGPRIRPPEKSRRRDLGRGNNNSHPHSGESDAPQDRESGQAQVFSLVGCG